MKTRTRDILNLLADNGHHVKIDSFNLETLVSIVMPDGRSEHLYSFNRLNEDRVATRIAHAFCSAEQLEQLDDIDLTVVPNAKVSSA